MNKQRHRRDHSLATAVTARAVLAGLALSALLNALAVRTVALASRYTGFTDHFNTIGVVFFLFALTLLALTTRRVARRWALRRKEVVVIYAMLLMATTVPTMGLGGYLFPLLAGLGYYATPENRWADTILARLPRWVAPHDAAAVKGVFEGLPPGVPFVVRHDSAVLWPWTVWAGPCLYWGVVAVLVALVSLCALSLIHARWSTQERLTYPLVQVPLQLAGAVEEPHGGALRRSVLWIGFALAALPRLYNYGVANVPALLTFPPLPMGGIAQVPRTQVSFSFGFDSLVLGLSYLVQQPVLLSVWLFHWLAQVEQGVFNLIGFGATTITQPHSSGGALLAAQQVGALGALGTAALWGWWRARRDAPAPDGTAATGLAPPRAAAAGLLVGLLALTALLTAAGLPGRMAALFLFVTFGFMFGTTRLLAQTGLGRLRAAAAPGPFLAGLLGAEAFGARGLAALGTQFTWAGDVQLFFMGTGSLALKAAGDTRLRPRGVALALGLALLVSLGVTFWLYLSIGYRHGWLGGYGWYFRSSPTYHWSWVASALAGQQPAELRVGQFLLLGAGLAAAVQAAYTARPGFPLHPAGLAIALTNTVWWDWASMFLAWLIKGLLLRAGGLRLYQRALPFFWGLILGSCAATGLTALLDMAR